MGSRSRAAGELILGGERFAYLAAGPEDGPLVLCLHGFPDLPRTWQPLLEALPSAGWRVVAPWMRGYAPSTLKGPFDPDRIAADVIGMVDLLSPDRPAMVVGHDWGAVATWVALSIAPDRFDRAAVLSVPHPLSFLGNAVRRPMQLRRSWYMGFFQLPGLPERVVPKNRYAFIERLWRAWSPGFDPPADHLEELAACFDESMPAPIEYYRAMFRPPGEAIRRMTAAGGRRIETPVLYLQGENDGCIAPDIARGQERFVTGPLEAEVIPGAGHFLQLERPDEVTRRIAAWLE